jgi:hypothetical protein
MRLLIIFLFIFGVEIEDRWMCSLPSLKGSFSNATIFRILFLRLEVKTSELISSRGEHYFFGAAAQAPPHPWL